MLEDWRLCSPAIGWVGPELAGPPRDAYLRCNAPMTNLAGLDLTNTRVTAEGVRSLTKLRGLEWLGIDGSQVDSETAAFLAKVPKLKRVEIAEAHDGRYDEKAIKALERALPEIEFSIDDRL